MNILRKKELDDLWGWVRFLRMMVNVANPQDDEVNVVDFWMTVEVCVDLLKVLDIVADLQRNGVNVVGFWMIVEVCEVVEIVAEHLEIVLVL